MKLSRIHVQTYRSIVDSGQVEIEPTVTVFIGKNEQGKTNFLKAIRSFNVSQKFSPADLPTHLRPELDQRKPDEIPIVTCWFTIEPQDRVKLKTIQGIETALEIKSTKYYSNNYLFWLCDQKVEQPLKFAAPDLSGPIEQIKLAATGLQTKLIAHGSRLPEFAVNAEKIAQFTSALSNASFTDFAVADDVIGTFNVSIKSLPGQDQAILDDIAAASGEFDKAKESIRTITQADASLTLKQYLPRFILHSTKADHIPNEVNIADFIKDAKGTSEGMANLCRAAGLSMQRIKELSTTSDNQEKETYEDYFKGTISGGLNEFWTQSEYNVHFRIDSDRLSVSISDAKYVKRIPPSDRSDGFQWYLSFYATLANDVGVLNETILLLDNPGLELHLDGQRDIKRYLEEKVSLNSQVLYVTHSPAMVDPFNLRQVREVELLPDQNGTKVRNPLLTAGPNKDLMEPIRAAIGMSLISSLVLNDWNVLVEGAADKPIVEGTFVKHYKEYREKVLVNGSVSETKDAFLVQFYHRTGLPYVVLLDADHGGREIFKELTRLNIPEERIVRLDMVFKGKGHDFAIEDILSAEFYHFAVSATYPAYPVDLPQGPNKKRSNLYEDAFQAMHQIGFSKRRVADMIKKLLAEGREDAATTDNLGILSTALIEKLLKQVPGHPVNENHEAALDQGVQRTAVKEK
jgi:predicted ATP-dependent endonuclease of OLD family